MCLERTWVLPWEHSMCLQNTGTALGTQHVLTEHGYCPGHTVCAYRTWVETQSRRGRETLLILFPLHTWEWLQAGLLAADPGRGTYDLNLTHGSFSEVLVLTHTCMFSDNWSIWCEWESAWVDEGSFSELVVLEQERLQLYGHTSKLKRAAYPAQSLKYSGTRRKCLRKSSQLMLDDKYHKHHQRHRRQKELASQISATLRTLPIFISRWGKDERHSHGIRTSNSTF